MKRMGAALCSLRGTIPLRFLIDANFHAADFNFTYVVYLNFMYFILKNNIRVYNIDKTTVYQRTQIQKNSMYKLTLNEMPPTARHRQTTKSYSQGKRLMAVLAFKRTSRLCTFCKHG